MQLLNYITVNWETFAICSESDREIVNKNEIQWAVSKENAISKAKSMLHRERTKPSLVSAGIVADII